MKTIFTILTLTVALSANAKIRQVTCDGKTSEGNTASYRLTIKSKRANLVQLLPVRYAVNAVYDLDENYRAKTNLVRYNYNAERSTDHPAPNKLLISKALASKAPKKATEVFLTLEWGQDRYIPEYYHCR